MSLTALSEDTLARVCSYLHPSERLRLRATCASLSHTLRPENRGLWKDVLRHKYGAHAALALAPRALRVREAADAHLCYAGAWARVLSGAPALAAYDAQSGALLAASGRRLARCASRTAGRHDLSVEDLPAPAAALAAHAGAVAVACDRAVTVRAPGAPRAARPLRGHAARVRSVAFLGPALVASGAGDGAVRLHDAQSRRMRGLLRGHGGAVLGLRGGDADAPRAAALWSFAADRAKAWDVEAGRCTRTVTGMCFASDATGATLYAAGRAPGATAVRVHDVRAPGVAAFLALPPAWGARPVEALAEDGGALAAAVGDAAVALWRARGPWQAEPLGFPGSTAVPRARRLAAVLLRDGVAYAAGGTGRVLAFGTQVGAEATVAPPPDPPVATYTQLLHAGDKRIAAVHADGVDLFDRERDGAVVVEKAARRAAGLRRSFDELSVHECL